MTTSGSATRRIHKLAPGALIDKRFRVLSQLLAGPSWVRYQVQDGRTGRELIMEIRRRPVEDAELERIMARYRAFEGVDQANVLPLYECGLEDDRLPYSLWEVRPLAQSLRNVLTVKGRLKPLQATSITILLARALAAIHTRGGHHGMMAPENTVVSLPPPSASDWLKVSGLSGPWDVRSRHEDTVRPGVDETALVYRHPQGATGPAADLYSLGVMTYEMLVGALPLPGAVPAPPHHDRPAIPSDISELTHRLLQGGPTGYQSAVQVLRELRAHYPRFFKEDEAPRRYLPDWFVSGLLVLATVLFFAGLWLVLSELLIR